MKLKIKNWLVVLAVIAGLTFLCGCQAMDAGIHHSTLHTDSKMSNPIFLDQLSGGENVYVRVFNTSHISMNGLSEKIKSSLNDEGYKIVGNPKKADYILQVAILQFGKADMQEYDKLYKKGQNFDQSAIIGAGAGVGSLMLGASPLTTIGAAAGAGFISWLANDSIQNETYSLITSVRVQELDKGKVTHTYDTAIASKADRIDLNIDEAKPILIDTISQEISGIFSDSK